MNMTAEIKRIKAEKKALLAKQREIKEKLNETKEERKQARSLRALARKEIKNQKSKFRQLTARINTKFSELESNEIEELAEELRAVCDELVTSVESFGKASAQLEI